MAHAKTPKEIAKIVSQEDEVKELKNKIIEKIKDYADLEDTGENADVKFAYVVFRSMEGKARLVNAYNYKHFWSKYKCLDKKKGANQEQKYLHGVENFLTVQQAPEPSLILWQNLGIKKNRVRCRQLISVLFSMAFVALIIAGIYYLKQAQEAEKLGFKPQTCNIDNLD